jgi:hypothetical protein
VDLRLAAEHVTMDQHQAWMTTIADRLFFLDTFNACTLSEQLAVAQKAVSEAGMQGCG